jgi:allantoinase
MRFDTVISEGIGVFPWGTTAADIGIVDGRIAAIANAGMLTGDTVVEASGKFVLPGAIDLHVHLREPGLTHKEDFAHGTQAAACGGVTLVFDMPNNRPASTTVRLFVEKRDLVARSAFVDFGLWAGGTNTSDYGGMAAAGACGLKIYMVRPRSELDAYQEDLIVADDGVMHDMLAASAALGWPVAVHVENEALAGIERKRLQASGAQDARSVYESYRGPSTVEALQRVLLLTRHTGARLHVVHLSLGHVESVAVYAAARAAGLRVTTEIPPPCLHLEELARLRTYALPFIADDREMEVYWEALRNGTIDAIATDHAPHTREDKEASDVWAAPPGYPGVETSLALMMDAALKGRLSVERVVDLMATGPARVLGLTRKGRLAVGQDADLVVFDPKQNWTIDEERLHSKVKWSPYHGRELRGRIVTTILRGNVLVKDGELIETRPLGQLVRSDQ